jgi:hypothetical protein
MAESTSTTRVRRPSMLVSELRAWEAARIPNRSMVPVLTFDRRVRRSVGGVGGVSLAVGAAVCSVG